MPGTAVPACNPSTWRLRQEDCLEFKASLTYILSQKPPGIQSETQSQISKSFKWQTRAGKIAPWESHSCATQGWCPEFQPWNWCEGERKNQCLNLCSDLHGHAVLWAPHRCTLKQADSRRGLPVSFRGAVVVTSAPVAGAPESLLHIQACKLTRISSVCMKPNM